MNLTTQVISMLGSTRNEVAALRSSKIEKAISIKR